MYTKQQLFDQLNAMGAPRDRVVLVHTSLRLIGEVEGGARGLLDALIDYFTERGGLLCVPTHTWNNLGEDRFTLDMTKCESNLGAFPVVALEDGRGVRSENPSHSVVVFGDREKALSLIDGEAWVKTPTAGNGFYAKLYEEDAYILLAGVGQNKNTYLHAVDEILGTKNRMGGAPYAVSVRRETGEILENEMTLFNYEGDYIDDICLRFTKYDLPFRYHGCVKDGLLGDAPTQLCSARGMFDVMKLIYERCPTDPLSDEIPLLPKYYMK